MNEKSKNFATGSTCDIVYNLFVYVSSRFDYTLIYTGKAIFWSDLR